MAQPTQLLLQPDEMLADNYLVQRCIGGGGMGQVWIARDLRLDRPVAIKVLHPAVGTNPAAAARFAREAKMLSRVAHPNVVAIHDYGQRGTSFYIVMELVDGESLEEWLHIKGALPLADAVAVTRQIAGGLAEAHALGIVHRDIKPANILLRRLATGALLAKVVDFGLARAIGTAADITVEQTVMGTPHYMSPEQIQGQALDGRSDLYSLATVMHEMLTGKLAFARDTLQGVLIAHLMDDPPPLGPLGSGTLAAPELEAVLQRAMAKSPEQRYATVDAFAEEVWRASGLAAQAPLVAGLPCATCARPLPDGCDYCPGCGSAVPLRQCQSCGAPRERQRLHCGACASSLVVTGCNVGVVKGQVAAVLAVRLVAQVWSDALVAEFAPVFVALVEREGGRPLAILGNEALAVFGLGGMRHDETEAAVDAALALVPAVARMAEQLQCAAEARVGVDLGPLQTMGTGTAFGVAWAAGPAVDLARTAALRNRQAGACVGPAAYRDVRATYLTTKIGRDHRRIERRKAISSVDFMAVRESAPLVGRDFELGSLRRALRKVARIQCARVVVIDGPAGAGKSHLLATFLRGIEDGDQGWHADIARCGLAHTAPPYEPFVHMLRARVHADDGATVGDLGERLQRLLSPGGGPATTELSKRRAASLARLVSPPQNRGDSVQWVLPGDSERRSAFEAYAAYLRNAAVANPVLLVIEDIDRASRATVELLSHAVQSCADVPLLVVLSGRLGAFEALVKHLQLPATQVEHLDLGPLELQDSAALIAAKLDGAAVPDDLVDALQQFSDGVPGALEEGVETLIDAGILVQDDAQWVARDTAAAATVLKRSRALVLRQRVQRLSASGKLLLVAIAAAGGNGAPRAMIAEMVGHQALEHDLSELKQYALVVERRNSVFAGERELGLRNQEAQLDCLALVDAKTVQAMHDHAVAWLQNWQGPQLPGLAALLAHHCGAANRPLDAAGHAIDAAFEAMQGFANRDALSHFATAARLADSTGDATDDGRALLIRALLGVAEVGGQVGNLAEAVAAAERVLQLANSDDAAAQSRARCARGDVREMQGEYKGAMADFNEAARLTLSDRQLAWLAVHAASRQAMVVFKLGRGDEARRLAQMALDRWQHEPSPALARALGRLQLVLGHVASAVSDHAQALEHYARAARHFRHGSERAGEAMAELSRGNVAFRSGMWTLAEEVYAGVAQLCSDIDHVHGTLMAQTNLGNVLIERGALERADEVLTLAEEAARRTGVVATLPETLRLLAVSSVRQGQSEQAVRYANESLRRATATGNEPQRVAALATIAAIAEVDDGAPAFFAATTQELPIVRLAGVDA